MNGEYTTSNESETAALGEKIAAKLSGGDVVAFIGNLGAGKTTMIKAIATALGADERETASPSFALVHDYGPIRRGSTEGIGRIYHIDLYRVEPEEIEQLGLWEIFGDDNICFVEWADKFPEIIPRGAVRIDITRTDEDARTIIIKDWNSDEE
ncbi:MAG: tRNA (adenosine(37)-N6)-threonylcarbamoyltransferase complex ATPase subunit type 1 TsaE [bacterium]